MKFTFYRIKYESLVQLAVIFVQAYRRRNRREGERETETETERKLSVRNMLIDKNVENFTSN